MDKTTILLKNIFFLFRMDTRLLIATYESLEGDENQEMIIAKNGQEYKIEATQILSILACKQDPEAKSFLATKRASFPHRQIRAAFNLDTKEQIFARKFFLRKRI